MLELPPPVGLRAEATQKHLLKAKDEERKAFVLQYSQIREEAQAEWGQDLLRGRSPLSGRCRPGANGCCEVSLLWWAPPVLGGERRPATTREFVWRLGSGSHGDSWKQHCRDLHRLFTAAKRKPSWTSGSDLGQWASPPRLSDSQPSGHS